MTMSEETAIVCTDCAADDHHSCVGRPECDCPCNDLAEQDERSIKGNCPTCGRPLEDA